MKDIIGVLFASCFVLLAVLIVFLAKDLYARWFVVMVLCGLTIPMLERTRLLKLILTKKGVEIELAKKIAQQVYSEKPESIHRIERQYSDIIEDAKNLTQERFSEEDAKKLRLNIERLKNSTIKNYDDTVKVLKTQTTKTSFSKRTILYIGSYDTRIKKFDDIIRDVVKEAGMQIDVLRYPRTPDGSIVVDIQRNIEDAEIIIANISPINSNTMYELGYAHALGKPVLILATNPFDIPLDVTNYQVIIYDETQEGLRQLRKRLKGALEETPTITKLRIAMGFLKFIEYASKLNLQG